MSKIPRLKWEHPYSWMSEVNIGRDDGTVHIEVSRPIGCNEYNITITTATAPLIPALHKANTACPCVERILTDTCEAILEALNGK